MMDFDFLLFSERCDPLMRGHCKRLQTPSKMIAGRSLGDYIVVHFDNMPDELCFQNKNIDDRPG